MKQLLKVTNVREIDRLHSDLPQFNAQDLIDHAPDAHWILYEDDRLLARCSLWWRSTPGYDEKRTGIIGHYAANDEPSATILLKHVCDQLKAVSCEYALGPMDGNTWRRYRLVTEPGSEPPFFLEPNMPLSWPAHWEAAGFTAIAEYSSRLNTNLNYEDPRLERITHRMQQQNVTIRALDLENYEAELRRVFQLSCISFASNFLYTLLPQSNFVKVYSQLQNFIRPELVLMAEQDSQLVGFLFALPDWLQAQRGQKVDTVIIKTVAVLPGRAYAGLGNLLAARCHSAAKELGHARAIHALMHDANHSRNVSSHYASVMRRYALFGRDL